MKIEIKNVKHAAFASQETECFNATIYVDGVKSGNVSNEGNGGPNRYEPHEIEERLSTYAKTLPRIDTSYMFSDGQKHTMECDADILVGNLLNEFLNRKRLKNLCAKKTLFRLTGKDYQEGEYNVIALKFTPEIKAKLVAKYGSSVTILNETLV
jgi:hypothetical protein